jgi:hypothetical protein
MTKIATLRSFTEAAQGNPSAPQQTVSAVPEMSSPAQQTSRLFAYQSYFDSTLLEKALLEQNKNVPIVTSTVKEEQIAGYAVGLHPSSQTPVAIQFLAGGQPSTSQAVTLKPGEIIRPHGVGRGDRAGHFAGFRWGLPFGWLGGGMAHLKVFSSPDSDVLWGGNPDVIFHRQRMRIYDPSELDALVDAPKNWPTRFPWTQAARGASSLDQAGSAGVAIVPTYTLMSLRTDALDASATMRILVQSSNEFDRDSANAPVVTPVRFFDYVWGTFAVTGGAGNLSAGYPMDFMPLPPMTLAADDGGIVLVDMTGTLSGGESPVYVDVVRYGKLG